MEASLGAFADDISLVKTRLEAFEKDLSYESFRICVAACVFPLGLLRSRYLVWELSSGTYRLDCSKSRFRTGASLENFPKGPFVQQSSNGSCSLGASAWKAELGNFGMKASVWNCSLGFLVRERLLTSFGLGAFDFELPFDNVRSGACNEQDKSNHAF